MKKGNHQRKRAVVSLTAVMLASSVLLVGCGDDPKAEQTSSENKIEKRGDISVSIYDRGSVPAAEGTIENNRWTKWINEKGPANATFVPIPRGDSQQKFNVLFASGSAPDLIFEFSPAFKNPWFEQKQLLPLDDLIEKSSVEYKKLLQDYPMLKKAGTKSDGKLYEFGKINTVEFNRAILIRADWLKKLGLSIPQTTDELLAVAKAFAEKDPDGNGKKDTFGIAMSYQSELTIDQMFQNVDYYVNNEGNLVRTWDQMQAAVSFKKQLVESGSVDKDYVNDKNGAKAKQDFITGKLGIYPMLYTANELTTSIYPSLKKNVPDAEFVFIPYPKSPAGQFNPTFINPVQMTAVVNAKTKNPEAVMKYVDFMTKQDTGSTLKYGLDGTHSKIGESGCRQMMDPDKFKNEVSYANDFTMLYSSSLEGKCGFEVSKLDSTKQKEVIDLINKGNEIYLNTSIPYAELTHSEHMPQLPKELGLIGTNLSKQIGRNTFKGEGEYWVKAIFGGANYSAEQAVADAKAAWEKAGGKDVDAWMANWYKESKDKAFLAKDIYSIVDKQKKDFK